MQYVCRPCEENAPINRFSSPYPVPSVAACAGDGKNKPPNNRSNAVTIAAIRAVARAGGGGEVSGGTRDVLDMREAFLTRSETIVRTATATSQVRPLRL
ncbi:hypothetical protein [Microbacterium sp. MMO-138]|uniref:hypothetical protein n=1 Tax=Microbacterium sp. MMO-138 TaxID=3081274 RepID=UPI003019E155